MAWHKNILERKSSRKKQKTPRLFTQQSSAHKGRGANTHRGATLIFRNKKRRGRRSFVSTHQLMASQKGTDIDYPMVTEDAGFPLAQKPSRPCGRLRPNPLPKARIETLVQGTAVKDVGFVKVAIH